MSNFCLSTIFTHTKLNEPKMCPFLDHHLRSSYPQLEHCSIGKLFHLYIPLSIVKEHLKFWSQNLRYDADPVLAPLDFIEVSIVPGLRCCVFLSYKNTKRRCLGQYVQKGTLQPPWYHISPASGETNMVIGTVDYLGRSPKLPIHVFICGCATKYRNPDMYRERALSIIPRTSVIIV